MQGGPVYDLLDVSVECPTLNKLKVEVGRILEDRLLSGLARDYWEDRHLNPSTSPAAISARFIDRLPWERNGTLDSFLSRATTSMASPSSRVAFGQTRGPFSVVDTTVAGSSVIRVT